MNAKYRLVITLYVRRLVLVSSVKQTDCIGYIWLLGHHYMRHEFNISGRPFQLA